MVTRHIVVGSVVDSGAPFIFAASAVQISLNRSVLEDSSTSDSALARCLRRHAPKPTRRYGRRLGCGSPALSSFVGYLLYRRPVY